MAFLKISSFRIMVWFRKFSLARTFENRGNVNTGTKEVILRRRGENKGEDKSKEINDAMETQEEQYSPSDFINHLVSDEKLVHRGSPSSHTSPVNKPSVTKVNPQTIIRPVPIMPLDSSIYSTPPTYLDNVPSAAKVPVVNSSLLATHLATSNITLSANNETRAHLVGVLQTQSQNGHESSRDLLDCKWLNCQHQFLSMDELVSHVNDHHVRVERPDIDYQCKWDGCPRKGKGFNARYKMLIHIRTHTNEKPHKCCRCGKSFSRLENLKIHMRSHTGEKPYTCPFEGCNKAYSNSSDRFKHVRTHQEDKPYICKMPGCSKRYTDPSSLRKHVRTHGHHYKEGSQVSAGHFRFNSNLVQDNSIETYKISNVDYSMSVTKSGSVPSVADADPQENSCLHFFNISSLVSNPLLSSGVNPVSSKASTAEIPVAVTVKSLSADSLANFGQQASIRLTSPSSQVEPLDLSTCSSSSASCESEIDVMACQQNPLVEHSITPEIGRWEVVQMSS